jgi:hypothetical protein
MDQLSVFSSFSLMMITVTCVYRWFLRHPLGELDPKLALQLVLAVHCFRFVSPISLVHGVTLPGLSTEFTYPQVIGDVGTAMFALIGIAALRSQQKWAIGWVWFTNLFGLVDLVVIGVQGTRFDFAGHIGAMFYIAAWYVPWLLLSHVSIFGRLMSADLKKEVRHNVPQSAVLAAPAPR